MYIAIATTPLHYSSLINMSLAQDVHVHQRTATVHYGAYPHLCSHYIGHHLCHKLAVCIYLNSVTN